MENPAREDVNDAFGGANAEKALLAALVHDGDIPATRRYHVERAVLDGITEECFEVPEYRALFREIVAFAAENREFSAETLCARLQGNGFLKDPRNLEAWNGVDMSVSGMYEYDWAKQAVLGGRQRRQVLGYLERLYADVKAAAAPAVIEDFVTRYSLLLPAVFDDPGRSGGFERALKERGEYLKKLVTQGLGAMEGLATGYRHLDEKLFGLKRGEMIVIAARPSVGKTTFAMNIARNAALAGTRVLVFSAEMDQAALAQRLIGGEAGVDQWRAARGQLTEDERRELPGRIEEAVKRFAALGIMVEDRGISDIADIRIHARRRKRENDFGLIVVDYLQLLGNRAMARAGRQLETAAISRELKAMARELRVPVIVISQLSRAAEQRGDRFERPKLSDLRDSGAIEQDADVVMLLMRPQMVQGLRDRADLADLIYVDVAKHRNGEIGEIPMRFVGRFNRFEDLPAEEFDAAKGAYDHPRQGAKGGRIDLSVLPSFGRGGRRG